MRFLNNLILTFFLIVSFQIFSQTSSNFQQSLSVNSTGAVPDSSAIFDIQSSDKGILLPRLTTKERDAITDPALGLLIFNTTDSCFNYYSGEAWFKDCGRSLITDTSPGILLQGSGDDDVRGRELTTDKSGNLLVIGHFLDTVTFGSHILTSNGGFDVFITKYKTDGTVLWVKQLGGISDDYGRGITTDQNENIFITGRFGDTVTIGNFTLTSAGSSDVFTVKFAADGTVLWANQGGGTSDDYGFGITSDQSGNVLVSGYFRDTADFGTESLTSSGGDDVFTVKYDSNGTVLWAKQGSGIGDDRGRGVATDSNNNYYITGFFRNDLTFGGITLNSLADWDVFTAKYASDGSVLWVRHGNGNTAELCLGIASDPNGNVSITGYFFSSVDFGGITLNSSGLFDVFTVKYNTDGTVLWARKGGGTTGDHGRGVTTDAAGSIYVTGYFSGTATFSGQNLSSIGNLDVFTIKYSSDGTLLWIKQGGGTDEVRGEGITCDASGNVFTTGHFNETVTFGDSTLINTGNDNMFVVQYNSNGEQILPTNSLSKSQDEDTSPTNELLLNSSLIGNSLNITDAGGTISVDLSGLIPVEVDPKVGNNTLNYLPKWDGTALVQSTSVFEDGSGNVGIGRIPMTNVLEVEGEASKSSAGDWLANSDARLKTSIQPLDAGETLNKILSLEGVTYEWDDHKTGTKRPSGIQYGFTAQNIQSVYPELVKEDNLGYLQTAYGTYDAMLIEAIRELNDKIISLESENAELKKHLNQQNSAIIHLHQIVGKIQNAKGSINSKEGSN